MGIGWRYFRRFIWAVDSFLGRIFRYSQVAVVESSLYPVANGVAGFAVRCVLPFYIQEILCEQLLECGRREVRFNAGYIRDCFVSPCAFLRQQGWVNVR